MFDISFFELVVCAVIALIVVGPEDFPSLVRNVIGFFRRARRTISAVRAEVEYEFQKADEIKRQIMEETRIADVHQQLSEVVDEATHAVPTTIKLERSTPTTSTVTTEDATANPPTPEKDPQTTQAGSANGQSR